MSFESVRSVVVTVSDSVSAGRSEDSSGPEAARILDQHGAEVDGPVVVADDASQITQLLRELSEQGYGLIVTTGGTGLAPRDVTPEATIQVCDRLVPGLGEVMRRVSLEKTPYAALSRGVAGTIGATLVINLPGSPGGVRDCLESVIDVLPHAVKLLSDEPTGHLQT